MTATVNFSYTENAAAPDVESTALSHLSLELGHLYMEDFERGDEHLTDYFSRIKRWAATATEAVVERHGRTTPRISTCFLIDDYFGALGDPRDIVHSVRLAAEKASLTIDYLARESACARVGQLDLAKLVFDQLVDEPLPGTTGSRPPLSRTGWLANGRRSSDAVEPSAMSAAKWQPAAQSAPNRHSIFIDVELWDRQQWSCAFLAAIWQLMRLGLVRSGGRQVVQPVPIGDTLPGSWADLPAVLQLTDKAPPFSAYRTFSILGNRFLETEVATRVVLGQARIAEKVLAQLAGRSAREQIEEFSSDILDRIEYLFISG